MKVVQINTNCGSGSTGKLCVSASKHLTERGIENYIFYSSGYSDYPLGRKYMSSIDAKFQAIKSRLLGNVGFNTKRATKRLVSELRRISPDYVHLHNLHGHNCNLDILFAYLKENDIRTYWTFHDCWAFTGYCPHYDMVGCSKWKSGCGNCLQRGNKSWLFDRSAQIFARKRALFEGMDISIVCPSRWLADQVRQSYFGNCKIKVINNGIDLEIFRPRKSDFAAKYGCEGKHIVLGVSFLWVYQKGLDVFIELAKRLDDRFQIVLVGTDDTIDAKLPKNIISIHRTNSQIELAEIYTASSVFVNPTRQEVLGLTNIEALACGTPVVMFNTGGSPECIDDTCGVAVEKDDIDSMEREIIRYCMEFDGKEKIPFHKAKQFDANDIYRQYCDLYFSSDV